MRIQSTGLPSLYDAIVVGAGPAGVSCAVWLVRLRFNPVLVDAADAVGGLCRINPFMDDWNASLPGVNGLQVADNLSKSLAQTKVEYRLKWPVQTVRTCASGFEVLGLNNDVLKGRYLVLATGVKARGLSNALPNPRVLVGPGRHVANFDFTNQRVAVLGGGDNAFENALFVLEKGARNVQVFARTVRAQRQFVQQLPASALTIGTYTVDSDSLTVNNEPYDVLLVMYGWEPNVEFAAELGLARTQRGFVSINFETAETSCDGVYAIGEVASRQHPCVVTALADGVTAAKAIQARLEANVN